MSATMVPKYETLSMLKAKKKAIKADLKEVKLAIKALENTEGLNELVNIVTRRM